MPFFSAKIKDANGATHMVTGEAESLKSYVSGLRQNGCIVISATEKSDALPKSEKNWPIWHPAWLRQITSFDVELGFRQIGSMLKSGVTILAALKTVAEQARGPRAARMWNAVHDKVVAGSSLSSAMESVSHKFGNVAIQLVKVGEHTGELDIALIRAAEQMEGRRNLRATVANALTYPIIATVAAIGVSIYLVVAVIPKIAEFLGNGGVTLPPMTQLLVDISDWVRLNGLYALAVILGTIIILFAMRFFHTGREIEDSAVVHLPIVGNVMRLSGTAIFSRAMHMLLDSGVTLLDALGVSEGLIGNSRMSRRVKDAKDAVMRGATLEEALRPAREFMPMLHRMAAVGETTGALGDAFAEVARFHEMMLSITIKRFSVTIEPAMIVITALIVGFVYVAFFMALFSMAGAA